MRLSYLGDLANADVSSAQENGKWQLDEKNDLVIASSIVISSRKLAETLVICCQVFCHDYQQDFDSFITKDESYSPQRSQAFFLPP